MTARWGALAGLLVALPGSTCDGPPPAPPAPPVATGGQQTGGLGGTGGWEKPPLTGGTGTGGAPVDDCEAAERRLRALDCRRALDDGPRWETPNGTPFATVCRERALDGDPLCAACIARVNYCEQVDNCRPRSPGECPQ